MYSLGRALIEEAGASLMVFQARVLEQVYRLQFLYELLPSKKAQSPQPRLYLIYLQIAVNRGLGHLNLIRQRLPVLIGKNRKLHRLSLHLDSKTRLVPREHLIYCLIG